MDPRFLANFDGDPNREDLTLMTLPPTPAADQAPPAPQPLAIPDPSPAPPKELGGRAGPDPTRYGDWELKGRCIDF
jgi:hypothetical protein